MKHEKVMLDERAWTGAIARLVAGYLSIDESEVYGFEVSIETLRDYKTGEVKTVALVEIQTPPFELKNEGTAILPTKVTP